MIMQVDQTWEDSPPRTKIDLDRITNRYSFWWPLAVPSGDDPSVPDKDAAVMENRSSGIHGNDGAANENALCGIKRLPSGVTDKRNRSKNNRDDPKLYDSGKFLFHIVWLKSRHIFHFHFLLRLDCKL